MGFHFSTEEKEEEKKINNKLARFLWGKASSRFNRSQPETERLLVCLFVCLSYFSTSRANLWEINWDEAASLNVNIKMQIAHIQKCKWEQFDTLQTFLWIWKSDYFLCLCFYLLANPHHNQATVKIYLFIKTSHKNNNESCFWKAVGISYVFLCFLFFLG